MRICRLYGCCKINVLLFVSRDAVGADRCVCPKISDRTTLSLFAKRDERSGGSSRNATVGVFIGRADPAPTVGAVALCLVVRVRG